MNIFKILSGSLHKPHTYANTDTNIKVHKSYNTGDDFLNTWPLIDVLTRLVLALSVIRIVL